MDFALPCKYFEVNFNLQLFLRKADLMSLFFINLVCRSFAYRRNISYFRKMTRFKDQNTTIYHFDNEILVECPKCNQKAIITKDKPDSYFSSRKLRCMNCFHLESSPKQSFIVELNCNCSNCGAGININIPNVNEKKESIAIKCDNCGITHNYAPRNIAQQWKYIVSGKPTDNYFGLPLWLNGNFRGENFWALNYSHLEYLKEYISAELRERNDRTHMTLVEKLPEWIKSGKNREKLIKLINELEKK